VSFSGALPATAFSVIGSAQLVKRFFKVNSDKGGESTTKLPPTAAAVDWKHKAARLARR